MADTQPPPDAILRALETVEADRSFVAAPLAEGASAQPTTEPIPLRFSMPFAAIAAETDKDSTGPARPALRSTLGPGLPASLHDASGHTAKSSTTYELLKRIGAGGQGEVWRSVQESLQREVAVKILTSGHREEFLREAFTSGALDHPNIVPVVDLGEAEISGVAHPMMAMKLVRGRPWNKILHYDRPKPGEPLDAFLAAQLATFLSVCNAVDFAHSRGIIHRDLKPSQVMIGDFGEVYLVDWGMALYVQNGEAAAGDDLHRRMNTMATATNPAGTPAYMAPEQTRRDTAGLGMHTDIYLLGGLLRELVTGRPPHDAQYGRASMLEASENKLSPLPDNCPGELRTLIDRAMATDPASRPKTVREIRTVVEDYLTGANRQRESRTISEGLARVVAALSGGNYGEFGRIDRQLSHALELWPGNHDAQELRQLVLRRHAEAALAAGDLQLSETLAQALRSDAMRDDLAAKIARARRAVERSAILRRRQRAVIGLLTAVLVVGGIASVVRERALRTQAERSLSIA
ncbi:MAG: serine/threonine-protein kinase, partial [Alphaproteobacteria bacterium]